MRHPWRVWLRAAALAMTVAAALALTGCAFGGSGDSAPTASPVGDAALFPREFESDLGDVTIGIAPGRVVAVTPQDADIAFALGAEPVGMLGEKAEDGRVARRPWQIEVPGAERPRTVGETTVDPVWVAELRPGVILATGERFSRREYDALSAIGPTIVRPKAAEPLGDRVQIELVGRALGLDGAARALADSHAASMAPAGSRGPVLVVVDVSAGEGVTVLGNDDLRTAVFGEMGFTVDGPSRFIGGDEIDGHPDTAVILIVPPGGDVQAELDELRGLGLPARGGRVFAVVDGDEIAAFESASVPARMWLAGRLAE